MRLQATPGLSEGLSKDSGLSEGLNNHSARNEWDGFDEEDEGDLDIDQSGNYDERPVVDDRDSKLTEIYGDYSRRTELEDKRYGPMLTKNSSISPADKEKMAPIID
ncbi:hypothetical protein V1505DRAFT_395030 [Lipomyces doorenjongii]